ncbi:MAG: AMP-binding protein [Alphaproteobacteria bacterium]
MTGARTQLPECAEERTVASVLARRVARHGDRPFLITAEGALSYRAVDTAANRIAHGIEALGIAAGEPVLIMLPNVPAFIVLWCALAKLGAIEVPVNTAYRGAILAHVLNDSGATTMIVDAQYLDRLAEVADRLGALERVIVHGGDAALPAALAGRATRLPYAALNSGDDTAPAPPPRHTDLVAVMYTSGTTGPSKGVMVSHSHAYHYASAGTELLDLGPDDVYYAPLPLFHIAGQWATVYAAMIAGAAAVVTGRFSVDGFWDDVRRTGATATFLLGAMANFLHRQPARADDATTPLRKALVVPLFPEIDDFRRRFGVAVTTTYGSTEVNVPVRLGFDETDWRTCGFVKDDIYEVRIVDDDDSEVPIGVPGELVVRSKEPWVLMAGYWRHPEWTATAWRNLWLHSGDIMKRDAAGRLYFVDRAKDAIRRRGENISSIEVETEINAHPDVLESAVIPVESDYSEQDVMAVVVPRPGRGLDPAALIDFLAPRMAAFMLPRYVEVVDALPKTPTGKIQKYPLRERGVTPATWDHDKARDHDKAGDRDTQRPRQRSKEAR